MVKRTVKTTAPAHRALFHTSGGGVDFSRLFEQLVPTVVVGLIVIYANSKVTEYQLTEMRKDLDRTAGNYSQQQVQVQSISVESVRLSAQIASFLSTQNALNAAMDARLVYLERRPVR